MKFDRPTLISPLPDMWQQPRSDNSSILLMVLLAFALFLYSERNKGVSTPNPATTASINDTYHSSSPPPPPTPPPNTIPPALNPKGLTTTPTPEANTETIPPASLPERAKRDSDDNFYFRVKNTGCRIRSTPFIHPENTIGWLSANEFVVFVKESPEICVMDNQKAHWFYVIVIKTHEEGWVFPSNLTSVLR